MFPNELLAPVPAVAACAATTGDSSGPAVASEPGHVPAAAAAAPAPPIGHRGGGNPSSGQHPEVSLCQSHSGAPPKCRRRGRSRNSHPAPQRPRHAPAGGGQAPSTSGLAAAVAPVAQTASGSGGGGGGKRKAAAAGRAVDATAKSAAAKAAAEEERVKREGKEAMARPPSRWRGWPSGRRRRRSGGGRRRSRWRSGGERGRQTCRWSLTQAAIERAVGIIWWRELPVRAPVRGRQLAPPMAPPSGACAARKGDRRASGDCERAPYPPIHSARIARSRASRFGRSHLRR